MQQSYRRQLRIALAQLPLEDGDLARNMQLAQAAAVDAADRHVDILCIPEAADFGWLHQEASRDALPVPGTYTLFLSDLARKHKIWICAGCLEKDGTAVYNSAVIINREGNIVLKHRKIRTLPDLTKHLYDAGPAGATSTVDTEFGKVGLTICADNFDLAIPKRAAGAGAWLLLTPHGFAAPVPEMRANAEKFQKHICGIASHTGMWVAGANVVLAEVKGGAWKGQMHCGCSTIARPNGTPACVGKFKQPDMIVDDIG